MHANRQNFDGLRVAAFESRRADEMARMIEKLGGRPTVSPSMREVPLEDYRGAIDFANRLLTGEIEVVIFMTGVGARALLAGIERHVDRQRFLDALSDTTTVVRGPKPLVVLKEWGIEPTHRVPEPNTWRELLRTVDAEVPVANRIVVLQEYGVPNASLVAGLEARGATVVPVRVYTWDFPEDTAPLEQNVRRIAAGEIDVVLFTSANQVRNLLEQAARLDLTAEVRAAFDRMVVSSIGPTTSEMLREAGLQVDMEPEHAKMGHLVAETAERAGDLLKRKRRVVSFLSAPPSNDPDDKIHDSIFLRACRREPTARVPIWLMRQAGRYMSEYREVRAKTTFLELCKNPELCAEVMITAVNRLQVDAAIIFADLLPILEPMGFELEFAHGEGPVIHNPVRESADVDRAMELESVESLGFVMETVRLTRAGLPGIPVIGFAGAPFTLASYAIEGGGSRNYLFTKTLMYRDPGAWNELMSRLSRTVARYLNAQIAAGAHAVQLFDSWVGCLSPSDYRRYVLPHTQNLISSITPGVPGAGPMTGLESGSDGRMPIQGTAPSVFRPGTRRLARLMT